MSGYHAFETFLREQKVGTLFDEPLGPLTTFKCGGTARYLIQPKDSVELAEVIRRANENDIPFRLLGGGACILVRDDGVDEVVIRLRHFNKREFSGDFVKVEGGYNLSRLVKDAVREGLTGLECVAGIPGTVAGALAMNAGGRNGEICNVVCYVDIMDREGHTRRLGREEIEFRYRNSSLAGSIILGCGLQLRYSEPEDVYERYSEIMADKKATQPMGTKNAGCVFKNPPGNRAGQMIEAVDLKGARFGRAHVSTKHANFIINEGGCRTDDVLRLIDLIRTKVRDRFETFLELEIYVW